MNKAGQVNGSSAPPRVWIPALIFTSVLLVFLLVIFFVTPSMTPDQREVMRLLFSLLSGFSTAFISGSILLSFDVKETKVTPFRMGVSATAGIAVFIFTYAYAPYWSQNLSGGAPKSLTSTETVSNQASAPATSVPTLPPTGSTGAIVTRPDTRPSSSVSGASAPSNSPTAADPIASRLVPSVVAVSQPSAMVSQQMKAPSLTSCPYPDVSGAIGNMDVYLTSVDQQPDASVVWHVGILNRAGAPVTFRIESASYMVASDGTKYLTRPSADVTIDPAQRKIFDLASQTGGITAGDYRLFFVVKEFTIVGKNTCRDFAWLSPPLSLP